MRRDWPNLYRYVSRLVALMNEVKLDIKSKIDLSNLEILSATRVCIRKFVLRIIKLTERDLGSLANLVFMVYLVVFSNSLRDQAEEMLIPMAPILFEYFGSLEKHLFLDRLKVVNQDLIESRDQVTFVDDKLILETIACFKFLPI